MTTREEINQFIKTLSPAAGHRDRVEAFCEKFPTWNPIEGKFEEVAIQ